MWVYEYSLSSIIQRPLHVVVWSQGHIHNTLKQAEMSSDVSGRVCTHLSTQDHHLNTHTRYWPQGRHWLSHRRGRITALFSYENKTFFPGKSLCAQVNVCMYFQRHSPSFSSQPSLSGLKKVCVRSLPSSSGILKGSFLMLSYRFYNKRRLSMNTVQVHGGRNHSSEAILTLRRSSGKSPPSLIPLFMEMNRSTVGLSFTFGLWRLVFSMMMANDRM